MTSADPDPVPFPLPAETVAELSQLISAVCDQTHTIEQLRRLNEILDRDPLARGYYLRFIALHHSLTSTAGNQMRREAEDLARRVATLMPAKINQSCTPDCCETRRIYLPGVSLNPDRRRRGLSPRTMAAIAAALLVTTLGYWLGWPPDGDLQVTRQDPLADANARESSQERTVAAERGVATVSYVSSAVEWHEPNDSFALRSDIADGQLLTLADGEIELTYQSAVRLRLIGPVDFVVRQGGGHLARGGIVASVPVSGHGFTIHTPDGKVVDLGTEFGVVVDDFGTSEVSVFSGRVEAYPPPTATAGREKFELNQGHALQWNAESLLALSANRRRFAANPVLAGQPGERTSPIGRSLDVDFVAEPPAASHWRTLGDVTSTPAGKLLRGETGVSQQPYLISNRSFDPANGPVNIVCDFVFPNSAAIANASIAVLTRSADKRGKARPPWEETLATCVRCCYRAAEQSGEGILEAATKHESVRELTNISWRGFQRPQSGVEYRLYVRDDGVNVSFTVLRVDDPTVRKTVKCRSLFGGYQNFVAVEGGRDGVVVIRKIRVFQEETNRDPASLWPSVEGGEVDRSGDPNTQMSFAQLLPDEADLVLSDDFEDRHLNQEVWRHLGVVEQSEGRLRLGGFDDGVHIDTWHPRPYLLTRQEFAPLDESLTVVGKLEFADNFLTGYGGAFGVMTRASASLGRGPGWENSILTEGVRASFWPLGLGSEHALEIYERPSAQIISLLAAEGFQINPRARSYLFRVVDDGRSITLTVVDALDPTRTHTIAHETTAAAPRSGLVGFESCWGSPILLDDVHIYCSPRPRGPSQP